MKKIFSMKVFTHFLDLQRSHGDRVGARVQHILPRPESVAHAIIERHTGADPPRLKTQYVAGGAAPGRSGFEVRFHTQVGCICDL